MARRITGEQLNRMSTAQLKAYINRTAKKANRDLRALEAAGAAKGSRAYHYVEAVAFDNRKSKAVQKNEPAAVVATNKKGEVYFKTSFTGKETRGQLLSRAAMIAGFKGAKTHTVKGVESAYSKSYNTYVNKRAREIARERAGSEGRKYTRADVLKAKRDIQGMADKNHFNEQWGALSKENYEKVKRNSETAAQFFASGYTADELIDALDKIGEEGTLAEYIDAVRGEMGAVDRFYDEGEYNPFLE